MHIKNYIVVYVYLLCLTNRGKQKKVKGSSLKFRKKKLNLSAFLFHLFKIMPYAFWDGWLCNTNTHDFDTWSITCAVTLESIFHLFANL